MPPDRLTPPVFFPPPRLVFFFSWDAPLRLVTTSGAHIDLWWFSAGTQTLPSSAPPHCDYGDHSGLWGPHVRVFHFFHTRSSSVLLPHQSIRTIHLTPTAPPLRPLAPRILVVPVSIGALIHTLLHSSSVLCRDTRSFPPFSAAAYLSVSFYTPGCILLDIHGLFAFESPFLLPTRCQPVFGSLRVALGTTSLPLSGDPPHFNFASCIPAILASLSPSTRASLLIAFDVISFPILLAGTYPLFLLPFLRFPGPLIFVCLRLFNSLTLPGTMASYSSPFHTVPLHAYSLSHTSFTPSIHRFFRLARASGTCCFLWCRPLTVLACILSRRSCMLLSIGGPVFAFHFHHSGRFLAGKRFTRPTLCTPRVRLLPQCQHFSLQLRFSCRDTRTCSLWYLDAPHAGPLAFFLASWLPRTHSPVNP